MPITPKHPGVYVEEVPSGARTITGVATAITAFVGRAVRGPVDEAVRIQGYEDYSRTFGGLSLKSTVSYAVQHFFQNGGTDALIVRCYRPPSTGGDGVASLQLPAWSVEAQGTLTIAGNPQAGDTMTIGSYGYTFESSLSTAGDGNIHIGNDVAQTRKNVVAAINDTGASGTQYGSATAKNPDVQAAEAFVGPRLVLTARTGGVAGNNITTTSTFSDSDNGFDANTLGTTRPGADPSGTPIAAQGTLKLQGNRPASGDTMTIGDVTYTFRASASGPGDIEIGNPSETRNNVVTAINDPNGHPEVQAKLVNNDIVLTAKRPGSAGNEIATLGDFTDDEHGFDDDTLGGTRKGADPPSISLVAANPGAWANNLRVTVDHDVADHTDATTFNLEIAEIDPSLPATAPPVRAEDFRNLSVDADSPLHVDRVLESRSRLARVGTTSSEAPGPVTEASLAGGDHGRSLTDAEISGPSLAPAKKGLWALENADLFNMLCIPPLSFTAGDDIDATTRDAALEYCKKRRAFFILDPPSDWASVEDAATGVDALGLRDENVAVYFPRVRMADPLRDNQLSTFAPCGVIAGVYARTDARRGVWKAPAGVEATMTGVRELQLKLTDGENGRLNPLGVSCLRTFPVVGNVVWGARTLRGADQLASEWKYVPVRRLALFLEETLYRALQWVVFEPNDEPLWSQIRLNVGSFMHTQFRKGAFQGASPQESYLVKCDKETTTQDDIDRGIVNILVGFAPLKPAEFVFLRIQQLAGQQEV